MSNTFTELYKAKHPEDTDPDNEITLLLGDEMGERFADFAKTYPDFASEYRELDLQRRQRTQPSLFGEATRGLSRGVDSAQANVYGALGSAGALFEPVLPGRMAEWMQRTGKEGYERNIEEARENEPTIRNVEEAVTSPGRFARWATGMAAEQVPQIGGALAAGAVGAVAGGPIGALGGAATWGYAQNQNYQNLIDQGAEPSTATAGISTVQGLASGALDTVLPYKILKKARDLFPDIGKITPKRANEKLADKIEGDAIKRYFRRAVGHVSADFFLEAGTEATQEGLAMASEYWAHRGDPTFEIPEEEIKSRLLNAAAAGGLLGGAVGAAEAFITPRKARDRKTARAETTDVPPPPDPTVSRTTDDLVVNDYMRDFNELPDDNRDELLDIANREINGTTTEVDKSIIRNLPLNIRKGYQMAVGQLAKQIQAEVEAESVAEAVIPEAPVPDPVAVAPVEEVIEPPTVPVEPELPPVEEPQGDIITGIPGGVQELAEARRAAAGVTGVPIVPQAPAPAAPVAQEPVAPVRPAPVMHAPGPSTNLTTKGDLASLLHFGMPEIIIPLTGWDSTREVVSDRREGAPKTNSRSVVAIRDNLSGQVAVVPKYKDNQKRRGQGTIPYLGASPGRSGKAMIDLMRLKDKDTDELRYTPIYQLLLKDGVKNGDYWIYNTVADFEEQVIKPGKVQQASTLEAGAKMEAQATTRAKAAVGAKTEAVEAGDEGGIKSSDDSDRTVEKVRRAAFSGGRLPGDPDADLTPTTDTDEATHDDLAEEAGVVTTSDGGLVLMDESTAKFAYRAIKKEKPKDFVRDFVAKHKQDFNRTIIAIVYSGRISDPAQVVVYVANLMESIYAKAKDEAGFIQLAIQAIDPATIIGPTVRDERATGVRPLTSDNRQPAPNVNLAEATNVQEEGVDPAPKPKSSKSDKEALDHKANFEVRTALRDGLTPIFTMIKGAVAKGDIEGVRLALLEVKGVLSMEPAKGEPDEKLAEAKQKVFDDLKKKVINAFGKTIFSKLEKQGMAPVVKAVIKIENTIIPQPVAPPVAAPPAPPVPPPDTGQRLHIPEPPPQGYVGPIITDTFDGLREAMEPGGVTPIDVLKAENGAITKSPRGMHLGVPGGIDKPGRLIALHGGRGAAPTGKRKYSNKEGVRKGEGHIVYGWGFYATDLWATAKHYADQAAEKMMRMLGKERGGWIVDGKKLVKGVDYDAEDSYAVENVLRDMADSGIPHHVLLKDAEEFVEDAKKKVTEAEETIKAYKANPGHKGLDAQKARIARLTKYLLDEVEAMEQVVFYHKTILKYAGKVIKSDEPKGGITTVRLNVDPEEDLLDWDKPYDDQSQRVKDALESVMPSVAYSPWRRIMDGYGRGLHAQWSVDMTIRSLVAADKKNDVTGREYRALESKSARQKGVYVIESRDRDNTGIRGRSTDGETAYKELAGALKEEGQYAPRNRPNGDPAQPGDWVVWTVFNDGGKPVPDLAYKDKAEADRLADLWMASRSREDQPTYEVRQVTENDLSEPYKKASLALLKAGVRGIRYLDQGSRGGGGGSNLMRAGYNQPAKVGDWGMKRKGDAEFSSRWVYTTKDAAERRVREVETLVGNNVGDFELAQVTQADLGPKPTYNYVIFDDKDIEIIAEDGVSIPLSEAVMGFDLNNAVDPNEVAGAVLPWEDDYTKVPDPTPLDGRGLSDKFTGVRQWAGSVPAKRQYQQLLGRLALAGVNVEVFQQMMDDLSRFLGRPGGLSDPDLNLVSTVIQVLGEPTEENLKVLIEEAVHNRFAKEDPRVMAQILRAVADMTDEQMGIKGTGRASMLNPNNLPIAELMEERLAAKLAANGVQDLTIAQQIINLIREVFHRVAMAIQSALGLEPSPGLALSYFENKFQQFVTGSVTADGFISWLGGGRPSAVAKVSMVTQVNGGEWSIAYWDPITQQMELPLIVPDTLTSAALSAQHGAQRWSKLGSVTSPSPTSGVGAEDYNLEDIAANNENFAILDGLFKFYNSSGMNHKGKTFEAFAREYFGLREMPDKLVTETIAQLQANGLNPTNVTATILGPNRIATDEFRQKGAVKALLQLQRWIRHLVTEKDKAQTELETIGLVLPAKKAEADQLKTRYADANFMSKIVKRSVKGLLNTLVRDLRRGIGKGINFGVIAQELVDLTGLAEGGQLIGEPIPNVEAYLKAAEELADTFDGLVITRMLYEASAVWVDWTRPIKEIRQVLAANLKAHPQLAPMLEDSIRGRLMISAASGFAKTNDGLMAFMRLAREHDPDTSEAITSVINAVMSSSNENSILAKNQLDKLPRLVKVAERIKVHYEKVRDANRRMIENEKEAREMVRVHNALGDSLRLAIERVQSEIGASLGVEVTHEAEIHDPVSPSASIDEVASSKRKYYHTQINQPDHHIVAEVMARQKAWLDANSGVKGAMWNTVNDEYRQLEMEIANKKRVAIQTGFFPRILSSLSNKLRDTGTGGGRAAAQKLLRYVSLVGANVNEAIVLGTKWAHAKGRAMKAIGIKSNETFMEQYHDRPFAFIESMRHLTAKPNAEAEVLSELRKYLRSDQGRATVIDQPGAWDALVTFWKKTADMANYFDGVRRSMNLPVKDDALGYFRDSIGTRFFTIPRRLHKDLTRLYHEMRGGWVDALDEAKKGPGALSAEYLLDPAAFSSRIQRRYTSQVWNEFVKPIIHKTGRTLIAAPPLKLGGLKPLADRDVLVEAYRNSGGSIVRMAEIIGGPTLTPELMAEHVGNTIDTFNQIFARIARIMAEQEKPAVKVMGVDMVPHDLMDARLAEDFPTEWLSYYRYDQMQARSLIHRLAMHASFGRDFGAIVKDIEASVLELKSSVEELDSARKRVADLNLGKTESQIEALVKKEIIASKGVKHWQLLKHARGHFDSASLAKSQLDAWFSSSGAGLVEMKVFQEALYTISAFIIQGPKSALVNTISLFDPISQPGGFSKQAMRQVGSNVINFMGTAMGSMFQTFNLQVAWDQEANIKLKQAGRLDTDAVLSLKEKLGAIVASEVPGHPVNQALIKGMRMLRETFTGTGLYQMTPEDKRLYPTFKPTAPFTWLTQVMHAAMIKGVWQRFDSIIQRGADHFKDNPIDYANPKFEFMPSTLGFGDLRKDGVVMFEDARSFLYIQDAIQRYGLGTLERMSRAAMEFEKANPGKRQTFTPDQMRNLASLVENEISLESNITNRHPAFLTNPILKMSSILVSWSFSKAEMLRRQFREPGGEASMQALLAGMKIFAAILPVGIAYAFLMDKYDEYITGKKSNLRGFGQDNNLASLVEQSARVGIFGPWGDLGNSVVNMAMGSSDLKGVSLDSRILFMSSILGLISAANTVIHQDDLTYATFYRPLLQSVGGSGYLQYVQAINNWITPVNELPLFEQELKVTARINVGNYLRAAGRELGLDVRQPASKSGVAATNDIKPWITEMILAAYKDDSDSFQDAYQNALREAEESGKPDPSDFVVRSFRYANPLRTVFATPPSKEEYKRILEVLNERGRQSVSEAIDLINSYGESIGVRPFEGKVESERIGSGSGAMFDLNSFRASAFGSPNSSFYSFR